MPPFRWREGYGLTECVTASCLTPYHISREGSIGSPFPDTYYKIVEHGTQKEVPYGTEGEICLSGPTVMMGYLHHPEETAQTLQTHEDWPCLGPSPATLAIWTLTALCTSGSGSSA